MVFYHLPPYRHRPKSVPFRASAPDGCCHYCLVLDICEPQQERRQYEHRLQPEGPKQRFQHEDRQTGERTSGPETGGIPPPVK